MPVTLNIAVPDIATVLTIYDRIRVYRAPAIDGVYAEITAVGTRIPLVSGQTSYTYVDSAGTSTNYYRVSYSNSVNGLESAQSGSIQGDGDPALDVLTVEELKQNFLFGLELMDENGNEMPDSFFEFYIKSAVAYVEQQLDLAITQRTVLNERHDFHKRDYDQYLLFQLLNKPVSSVERVAMVLPTNQNIITYDPTWYNLVGEAGQLQILPGTNSTSVVALGLSGMWWPMTQGITSFLPLVFYVDYTTGFPPGQVPFNIKEVVGMLAAMGPLAVLGDILFGPGLAGNSVSLDVLMTNVKTTKDSGNSAFSARLRQYRSDSRERLRELRRYYQGVRFTVV